MVTRQTPEQREFAALYDACKRGDGGSCFAAGTVAESWEGRAPDSAETAEEAFLRGCDAQDASSCRRLGLRWAAIEPRTAALYLRRACDAGSSQSCEELTEAKDSKVAKAPPIAPVATPPPPTSTVVTGSCFFAAPAGIAVTNHHVVDGATEVRLVDARGRAHIARVLSDDEQVDLAVLEAVTAGDVAPLPLAPDKDVSLGAQVFTIGFPVPGVLGADPKFSEGSLGGQTGLGAAWLYQITVPVQPGNSGGPLVDLHGFVVGVIVAKLRTDVLAEDGVRPENVNFAIKSAEVRRVLRGLKPATAKAARTREAAIERATASVCQVIAKTERPVERRTVDAAVLETHRTAGTRRIAPDAATVAEMRSRSASEFRAVVEVCVTERGAVDRVTVTTSSGFVSYDAKLQREIEAWSFRPIVLDGHEVPICSAIEFKGRLRDTP